MPNTSLGPPVGTPALANSSAMITCSSADSPPPPYSTGQPGARYPASYSTVRHHVDEVLQLVVLQRPDAGPVARQLLGQERLHLVAVRLGLCAVVGFIARRQLLAPVGPAPSGPGRRRRPAAPRCPAGTLDVEPAARERSAPARRWPSRLRWSSSRRAASTRGGPNAAGTDPVSTTRRRSNTATAEAIARPIIAPVRSTIDVGVRRSGRFVSSSIADGRCVCRQAPGAPQGHGSPSGSTTTWPSWPALPCPPCSSRPLLMTPASTASDTSTTITSVDSWPRPIQRSASTRACPPVPSDGRQPAEVPDPLAQLEALPDRQVQRRDGAGLARRSDPRS